MLRIVQNSRPADAKSYFRTSDYYVAEQADELVGRWGGKAAAMLGLTGTVFRKDFERLCDNLDPQTGEQLTARTRSDRTCGYDFNFNAPKSLSLVFGLFRDSNILDAFRTSVAETMQDVENDMMVRVRKKGRDDNRLTGNMVYSEFVHFTARPVNGIADPSLHAHCFTFNVSHDGAENQWKAGQFRQLKQQANYYEALFHARLSKKMADLGFGIERKGRFWEIAGVSRELIERFSKRTRQIQKLAREKGITDPDRLGELGAKSRQKKSTEEQKIDLRSMWFDQLTEDDRRLLDAIQGRDPTAKMATAEVTAADAMKHAVSHAFERDSVIHERKLVEEFLRQGFGSVDLNAVHAELDGHGIIGRVRDGERLVSTREVLLEEQSLLAFARDGRAACQPLAAGHEITRDWLNPGQRSAVRHVLESPDRVMIVRGLAGTGKTTLTKEATEAIEAAGRTVVMVAPTAQAARGVLRDEGFAEAETLQRLLIDRQMQSRIRDGVLWIDEAGLVSVRDMARVMAIAGENNARVVLMGDSKQHRSPGRGAALRLLESQAGLVPAEVKDIKRQTGDYRDAVTDLADGRTHSGFDKLDKLGWVHESKDGSQHKQLAKDYADAIAKGESVLVVSPTHFEGGQVTAAIRDELKRRELLGKNEREFKRLTPMNFTEPQRADVAQYRDCDVPLVVQFEQNAKGFARGQRMDVIGVEGSAVRVRFAGGGETTLPLEQASKFQVYRSDLIRLAAGDKIRITHNGQTPASKRLNNGAVYNVAGFTESGDIALVNGWVLPQNWGFLTSGFVVTSHASQGRTVDRVLIATSRDSIPATGQEQLYVSASRGRRSAAIYTDDKRAIREAVAKPDLKIAASELFQPIRGRRSRLRRHVSHLQRMASRVHAYASRTIDTVRDRVAVIGSQEISHDR